MYQGNSKLFNHYGKSGFPQNSRYVFCIIQTVVQDVSSQLVCKSACLNPQGEASFLYRCLQCVQECFWRK